MSLLYVQKHVTLADEFLGKHKFLEAEKELKAAIRLNPTHKKALDKLECVQRQLYQVEVPVLSLKRFAHHYNLSLRYWDSGSVFLAKREGKLAIEFLETHGLPLGCALNNLNHMLASTPCTLDSSKNYRQIYRTAISYFDQRMLKKAEILLKRTRDLVKYRIYVEENRRIRSFKPTAEKTAETTCDLSKDDRITILKKDFLGIEEDLQVVRTHQSKFSQCDNTVRNPYFGEPIPLLPCMKMRFNLEEGLVEEANWLKDMSEASQLCWN